MKFVMKFLAYTSKKKMGNFPYPYRSRILSRKLPSDTKQMNTNAVNQVYGRFNMHLKWCVSYLWLEGKNPKQV